MFATISRRMLVLRGGVSAAGAAGALLTRGAFAAPSRLPVYRLVACGSCAACNACRRHAENKLFASVDAADEHRAHPGCNCGIAKAGNLPRGTWTALFGSARNPRRLLVDRRRAEVASLLE